MSGCGGRASVGQLLRYAMAGAYAGTPRVCIGRVLVLLVWLSRHSVNCRYDGARLLLRRKCRHSFQRPPNLASRFPPLRTRALLPPYFLVPRIVGIHPRMLLLHSQRQMPPRYLVILAHIVPHVRGGRAEVVLVPVLLLPENSGAVEVRAEEHESVHRTRDVGRGTRRCGG